jgi:DNA-binding transcriptional regulator of glucitol operon
MAVTAGRSRPHWTILLRPRWLAWHGFAVLATAGMLYLGDWQLHRAESGNELSWAYTFEWPLFAIFGVYFWLKTLRDELRDQPNTGTTEATESAPDPADAAAGAIAPAAADAYVERLKSEVRGHGKWHGWR